MLVVVKIMLMEVVHGTCSLMYLNLGITQFLLRIYEFDSRMTYLQTFEL